MTEPMGFGKLGSFAWGPERIYDGNWVMRAATRQGRASTGTMPPRRCIPWACGMSTERILDTSQAQLHAHLRPRPPARSEMRSGRDHVRRQVKQLMIKNPINRLLNQHGHGTSV